MKPRSLKVCEAINDLCREEFSWDKFNCCQFAALVGERVVGVNFAIRFSYSNEHEAIALINAAGGLDALITDALGVDPVGATTTEDGDPILLDLPLGFTVGVRFGERAVCKTVNGVVSVPLTDHRVLIGWRLEDALCRRQ